MSFLKKLLAIAVFSLPLVAVTQAEEKHDIQLKLFGENVVEDYDGCHFALWQKNRDPAKDKYSYVFYAPIPDAEQLPGWMKVGNTVYELERLDISADTGQLDKHQLFRDFDGKLTVHMEILKQSAGGNDLIVEDADLTVIMADKFPFVISVKGKLGCPASAYADAEDQEPASDNLDGTPISLSAGVNYDTFSAVPNPIIQYIRNDLQDCNLDQVPEYATRYNISDAMSLWEVPCALYSRNASTVFFTALNDNQDFFVPLVVQAAPGSGANDHFDVLNASVLAKNGIITSLSLGPGRDCGIYEKHQLRAVEGEAIELFMLEYREKIECDGVQTEPENFPLVYAPN